MTLMLMAMAALSQLIAIFETEGDRGGAAFICGLCAAACMLNALNAVVSGLLS